jgi:ferric-dicitrate binding protein FerR (iron transport regulator)
MSYLVEKERVHIVSETENYTLALSDGGGLVDMNNAAARTITVPTNATVAFPLGTQIILVRKGAGTLQVVAAGGVTINSVSGNAFISTQYGAATLVKIATNEWYLFGDLTGA